MVCVLVGMWFVSWSMCGLCRGQHGVWFVSWSVCGLCLVSRVGVWFVSWSVCGLCLGQCVVCLLATVWFRLFE